MCSNKDEEVDAATYLLERTKEEIKSVKGCAECYAHENNDPLNWFPLTCNEPHLIVWADYWPAKVMSISVNGLLNVRFFGNHIHADVSAENCFLFSGPNPKKYKTSFLYSAALKVRMDVLDRCICWI